MANEVSWPLLQLLIGARSRDFSYAPAQVSTFPDTELPISIMAYLGADPTADPGTWSAPVDFSSRLLDEPITGSRGRSPGQRTLSSGSYSFYLDNSDGYLTPLHGGSPYFGSWDLGVPMYISVDGVGPRPPYRRFSGFVSDITVAIIPGAGGVSLSTVKVTLGGVVRQRSQGSVAQSAMRRFVDRHAPIGYWPLGGSALSGIGGSDANLGTSTIACGCNSGTDTTVATDVVFRGDAGTASETVDIWQIRAGGYSAIIHAAWASGTPTLVVKDLDIFTPTLATGTTAQAQAAFDGEDHHWRLLVAQDGADVDVSVYLDGTLIMSGTRTTATAGAGAVTTLISSDVTFDATELSLWAGSNVPAIAEAYPAAVHYAGELAHVRIGRVCREEGVPVSVTAADSQPCGPQPEADFLAILRDAELVDHGVLREDLNTWGFTYLSGTERYNLAAAMTVDLSTYRIGNEVASSDVLVPVRNDQRIRNEWTISRPDGPDVTVLDTDHQAKKGRYNDSAEVNVVDDDALAQEGGWRVWEGTQDGLRYAPGVPVDVGSNNGVGADLLGDWLEMDLGARVDRSNAPSQHPSLTARLELEGYSETIRRKSWTAKATLEPFDIWSVLALADSTIFVGTDGWLDWDSCTLAADVDEDDISWSVSCSPVTATDASNYPMVIDVEGERVTVTAVSGSSSPQTWTVTRSTNGVTKRHLAGAVITSTELLIATL